MAFDYLGIPLRANPKAKHLDSWKGGLSTLSGCISLVKACLVSSPLHHLSLFRIPVGVPNRIEKLMRDFLSSGVRERNKDRLVNWDASCNCKEGGLGIDCLVNKNVALLGKWLWCFPLEVDLLWHRVIRSIYGLQDNVWDARSGSYVTDKCTWKGISQVYTYFLLMVSYKVRDGGQVCF